MKRLTILFLFISSFSFSQSWTPIAGKQRFTNGLGVPAKDTASTSAADTSMITIRSQDSCLWVKYKGDWYKVPRNTAANPNTILNGGNSFGATATIGTKDNNNLNIITNNNAYNWTFSKTGTLTGGSGNWYLDYSGQLYNQYINTGSVYPTTNL